jgi:hypothetical protein
VIVNKASHAQQISRYAAQNKQKILLSTENIFRIQGNIEKVYFSHFNFVYQTK